MKHGIAANQRPIANRQSGFAMLLTVLLMVVIFGLILTALLMIVTFETRRSVAQADTNAAFYAAEGAMNDTYIQLDSTNFANIQEENKVAYAWVEPHPDFEVEIVRSISKLQDANGEDYAEIDIEARVDGAKRRVVGEYYPGTQVPTTPGQTPNYTATVDTIEMVRDDWRTTNFISEVYPIVIGPNDTYIYRMDKVLDSSGNCEIREVAGQDICVRDTSFKRGSGPLTLNDAEDLNGANRVWVCRDSICPDFGKPDPNSSSHRQIYGLQNGQLKVISADRELRPSYVGSETDTVRVISVDEAAQTVTLRTILNNTESTHTLEMFDADDLKELVVSDPAILDDDPNPPDNRDNYLALINPGPRKIPGYDPAIATSNVDLIQSGDPSRRTVRDVVKYVNCGTQGKIPGKIMVIKPCSITFDEASQSTGVPREVGYVDFIINDSLGINSQNYITLKFKDGFEYIEKVPNPEPTP